MSTVALANPKTKFSLTEDWTVVVLGLLSIVLSLNGLIIPAPVFGWTDASSLFSNVFTAKNGLLIAGQFAFTYVIALIGTGLIAGKSVRATLLGFPVVFGLTLLALILAGNKTLKDLNLEAVIFSLGIGLAVGNLFRLPDWLRSSLSTELFVKIGLILLGTSVIFGDILKAGSLGLIQALAVVISVWYFAFWVSKRLKVDDELTMMLASAVSICGVSAAIATSGAIQGDSKKLSYVISLVLITAIPMMLVMPYAAHAMGLSPAVTGAWLGGTIDTSGAVVAAGTLAGEEALKISTIVKFSQNVLLGVAAFAISIYWTYTKNQTEVAQTSKPTLGVIWERFPKFVLGFLAASLLFSFVVSPATVDTVKGSLKSLQGLWFALAFTSIGLETRFSDLFNADNRRPMYAFLIAQTFNVVITLVIAYFLFR
ncbi:putative sulfate exporter family transporter [Spirosoma sp. HMF4905]|uniref:Putative sulfate exporter family transporter n=1 Tax=Spirosoma arboris TaxID=2682092 RepID=A0A7K1SDV9_9BACT|nr:putative sulfate exporter family transporter [Spirosoma arboris]MVM31997.1 putative sulfate exporter family transporter [Spirosoma arboris]